MPDAASLKQSALRTISLELEAVQALESRIDEHFIGACQSILACTGRVVVMGMGKSGHIGNKIAATLASTGTPAMFVHPAEASHGDIGMITANDVVIAISNSGTVPEVISLLPVLKRKGVTLIGMTGNPASVLGQASDYHLDIGVAREACPINLAPTSSTTATLVMGDALAMTLLEARGFTADDFAFSHPGGNLGRRLLLKVSDVMHTGDDIPRVTASTPVSKALLEMTAKKLGMTTVTDEQHNMLGVFTDGDLRRLLDRGIDLATPVSEVMTAGFKSISGKALASEAALVMQENSIYTLVVQHPVEHHVVGIITMHDLLRANVV